MITIVKTFLLQIKKRQVNKMNKIKQLNINIFQEKNYFINRNIPIKITEKNIQELENYKKELEIKNKIRKF
jgi:hypothetical protein